MGQRLRDIDPNEVGLVVRGANRRRFSVLKADEQAAVDEDVAAVLAEKADGEENVLAKLADGDADAGRAAVAAYRLVKAHAADLPAELVKAMDDMAADCPADDEEAELEKAAAAYDAVVKAKYTDAQRAAMAKSGEALPDGSYPIADKADLEDATHAVGRGKNNAHADIRAHIVKRAKALGATDLLPDSWNVSKEDSEMTDTATVPVKKEDGTWDLSGVAEDQRPAMEAFLKAQDEERERELEAIRKAADDQKSEFEKKADEAISIAKAERDARETREFVAKAESLGESGDEFGPVLKTISAAVEPDTFEKLEAVLKANHERAVKAGLYAEIGKSGHGNGSSDAETQLVAKADAFRTADPNLTAEQALLKAYEVNPELYAQLREEES